MTISLPIFTPEIALIETDTRGLFLTEDTGGQTDRDIAHMTSADAEENAANALLFKAAPKLFFALRDIVDSTADLDEEHRTQARIALRAALGE